jgi:hypothetical protein
MDSYQYEAAARALGNAADYLVAASNRRKALVYISEGVPWDPILAAQAILAAPHDNTGPNKGAPNAENHAIHANLFLTMQDTFRRAQRANVAIYSFDPSPTRFEDTLLPFLSGRDPKLGVGDLMTIAHHEGGMTTDFLEAAASNTGGRAVLKAPDAPAGIEQMFVENSSYYLLGYHSLNTKTDSYRNVSVKVNRPGSFEIRARNRYYVEKPADPKKGPVSAQEKAIAGMLPDPGIPLEITTTPFANPDGTGPAIVVAIGVSQDAPAKQGFQKLDYITRAFTPEGDARVGRSQRVNVAVHAASIDLKDEYDLLSFLPVKPGRYEVRASVHNGTLDQQGSVYGDVEVPEFFKTPLSLSGIVLTVKPMRVAAPYYALESILPVVPTTRRVFTHEEHVSAFLRAYQPKPDAFAPVAVAIRITDDHGNVVSDTPQNLAADDFSKKLRSADVTCPVPAVNLGAGNYLLTVEASTVLAKARRDVRFSVK